MSVYTKHFKVVMKHKWYVMLECFKRGLIWQGIVHDLSKFSPTEFIESAKHFQGTASPIVKARLANGYSYAWIHHKAHNKHHWDHWVDFSRGVAIPTPMPKKYLDEMVCDMIGAAKAYSGKTAPLRYYKDNVHHWIMTDGDKYYIRTELSKWEWKHSV